ncbi:UNVERIFIED_ORG: hypothetical protein CLV66_1292 [Actinomadura viridilutea]
MPHRHRGRPGSQMYRKPPTFSGRACRGRKGGCGRGVDGMCTHAGRAVHNLGTTLRTTPFKIACRCPGLRKCCPPGVRERKFAAPATPGRSSTVASAPRSGHEERIVRRRHPSQPSDPRCNARLNVDAPPSASPMRRHILGCADASSAATRCSSCLRSCLTRSAVVVMTWPWDAPRGKCGEADGTRSRRPRQAVLYRGSSHEQLCTRRRRGEQRRRGEERKRSLWPTSMRVRTAPAPQPGIEVSLRGHAEGLEATAHACAIWTTSNTAALRSSRLTCSTTFSVPSQRWRRRVYRSRSL